MRMCKRKYSRRNHYNCKEKQMIKNLEKIKKIVTTKKANRIRKNKISKSSHFQELVLFFFLLFTSLGRQEYIKYITRDKLLIYTHKEKKKKKKRGGGGNLLYSQVEHAMKFKKKKKFQEDIKTWPFDNFSLCEETKGIRKFSKVVNFKREKNVPIFVVVGWGGFLIFSKKITFWLVIEQEV